MLSKLIPIVLLLLFCCTSSLVRCEEPVVTCRSIHHTDVDKGVLLNEGCLLNCTIHNTIWSHNMSEGLKCGPNGQQMVCLGGVCVSQQVVGFIDVEVSNAEVPHNTNAYAEICIKNGTESQTLPLRDRQSCGICQTPTVKNSAHPVWNHICQFDANHKKWTDSATLTIQVWDQLSDTMTNFLGGVTLTVKQVLTNEDNHKEVRLKLDKGSVSDAYVFARITWTTA